MRLICFRLLLLPLPGLFATACAAPTKGPGAEPAGVVLRVDNHHELPYRGPVQFATDLPDGTYTGEGALGDLRSGVARVVVSLPAASEVTLARTGPLKAHPFDGRLAVAPHGSRLELSWAKDRIGSLELGLVVLPGTQAGPDDAVSSFEPLGIEWREEPGGVLSGQLQRDGFDVTITLLAYGGGWLDVRARLARVDDAPDPAYVALVRRVTAPELDGGRLRLNGRVLGGLDSPDVWERDFWYTRGVDWLSWKAGPLSFAAINGFTPLPTIQRDSAWVEGSHFYVWEWTRRKGDSLYLISEISGPNPEQAKSDYMKVTPYAPIRKGDALDLKWRLAIDPDPPAHWEESQLRVFAGYRSAACTGKMVTATEVVDLGVPGVAFGTSYFPFSTFAENFDYYRTPGLDQETWWPFSAQMWSEWRAFVPRMQTDLHIIRAMGFDWVRLHHLELLQQMDRAEAIAFLDWFTAAARELGLQILVDTEGPAEWVAQIAGRYGDVITRYELENEILIFGIKPDDPARWTEMYHAAKQAAPHAQVFFTSAGNHGMFERLRALGVPFDRVGLHAYKHGPEWMEAFSTHALGTGGYASDIGKPATLGEFNWKNFTRLSPEDRREKFIAAYENMLEPRALPEFFQFHFQETLSVNPSIARSGIRHYETIALDRRPKPEALELMRLIREYARPDAPVREVAVEIGEVRLVNGQARAPFTVTNNTSRPLSLELDAVAFSGIETNLASPERVTLQPGGRAEGVVELQLGPASEPGTYHHFLRATYGEQTAYGWGVASNPGAPEFEKEPVLKDRVAYPQGAGVVGRIDWSRPLAVAFGPEAPVLELEMAYITANTLQSATGRPVYLSSTADLPDSLANRGTLILVGTAQSNPLIGMAPEKRLAAEGVVVVQDGRSGAQRVLLTGRTKEEVQAAATDFVLRYWQNAKDAAIRVTGIEQGAALGNKAAITNPDPQ